MIGRVDAAAIAAPNEPQPPGIKPADLPDPDLDAAWAEGLREREEYDTRALLGLVMNSNFGVADLPLTPAAAEAIARASVRVRLHLRETLLRDLNSLEVDGDLDVFRLAAARAARLRLLPPARAFGGGSDCATGSGAAQRVRD